MKPEPKPAPELRIARWFNASGFDTPEPITLDGLRGRVVVIEAFQMLCPGCVSHGLPQAQQVFETFNRKDVAVLGLHSVFEHHPAQGPTSLEAFLYEYRIPFPVGVDMPGDGVDVPQTMAAYQLRGTPSMILIDRQGRKRAQHFGHVPDLRLGAEIMALVGEAASPDATDSRTTGPRTTDPRATGGEGGCVDGVCPAPRRMSSGLLHASNDVICAK